MLAVASSNVAPIDREAPLQNTRRGGSAIRNQPAGFSAPCLGRHRQRAARQALSVGWRMARHRRISFKRIACARRVLSHIVNRVRDACRTRSTSACWLVRLEQMRPHQRRLAAALADGPPAASRRWCLRRQRRQLSSTVPWPAAPPAGMGYYAIVLAMLETLPRRGATMTTDPWPP